MIMKRKFTLKYAAAVMALCLWASPIAVKAAEAEPVPDNMEETVNIIEMTAQGEIVSDVFVREGPSTAYEVIGTVRERELVPISGKTADEWYQITFEGRPGFVYGDYIRVVEEEPAMTPPPEETGEPEAEDEEEDVREPADEQEDQEPQREEHADGIDWGYIRLAAIVVIVAVILAMIVLILRSLLQASLQENEEEKRKSSNSKKAEKARIVRREDKKAGADGEDPAQQTGQTQEEPKAAQPEEARTIIIREEDYQLHIDPKYFEDEPLAQPDYVTDYLKKKELEDTKTVARKEHADDLVKAMKKLEELQEEIERLKNK